MKGGQPTPASAEEGKRPVEVEDVVRGCGVEYVQVVDPYDVPNTVKAIREAYRFTQLHEGPAVIISRRPCPLIAREQGRGAVRVTDDCTGCMSCVQETECPALEEGQMKPLVHGDLCRGCGLCMYVCPAGALKLEE